MTDDVEKINQAMSTAEQFSELYYKKIDSERHSIDKMYHENANMTWNGNNLEGIADIKKFILEKLPNSSTYVNCLDSQPVHDSAVGGQTTVLVTVAGTVKYGGSQPAGFQQNFLLAAKDGKWKIVTDTFRSQ